MSPHCHPNESAALPRVPRAVQAHQRKREYLYCREGDEWQAAQERSERSHKGTDAVAQRRDAEEPCEHTENRPQLAFPCGEAHDPTFCAGTKRRCWSTYSWSQGSTPRWSASCLTRPASAGSPCS